jgi:hypothetical protein
MKEGWLRKKYHSLAGRRGKKRALMAIAHKILNAVYYVLKDMVPYKEPDLKYSIRN